MREAQLQSAVLELERFGAALRRHWRRILAGATVGWFLTSILGAIGLVALERSGWLSYELSNLLGAALVWAGVALGGLVAYALRRSTGGARP